MKRSMWRVMGSSPKQIKMSSHEDGGHQENISHQIDSAGITWAHRYWNSKHLICICLHQGSVYMLWVFGVFVRLLTVRVGVSLTLILAFWTFFLLLTCLSRIIGRFSSCLIKSCFVLSGCFLLEDCSFWKRKWMRSGSMGEETLGRVI